MKKILLIFLLFVFGCYSTQEPATQKDNKIKANQSVKIVFSNKNEILILQDSMQYFTFEQLPNNFVLQTAKNHCSQQKKNTYTFLKKAAPISYWSTKAWSGDNSYQASKYDMYEQIQIEYKKKLYSVWRYRCAKNQEEARKIKFAPNYKLLQSIAYFDHVGKAEIKEYKRTLSKTEIAENKAKVEKERLAKLERERKEKALKRQKKIVTLETSFGEACTSGTFKKGFAKGTQEYENCLFQKEKEAIAKQKAIDAKLAKMTPVQRREYNCEETFQFRKGSDKFKDCVFKLYTTELELQKLELQKQVAEAKLEAEKAKAKAAATEKARADAVARAQIAAAEAQKAAAKSQSLATSMSLMQLGSSMMSSPAPAPSNTGRVRTTCRNVGGFLNCY